MSERNTKLRWLSVAVSVSVTLYLLCLLTPLPGIVRVFIVGGLAIGWLWIGIRWSIERFGRTALVALGILVVCIAGVTTTIYWIDFPNRQLAGKIEQIPGCYTTTNGGLITGKIDHVYINAKATDRDVREFMELDKFEDLSILFLDGARINDATAKALVRFQSLQYLMLAGTGVSEEAAEVLRRELPNCRVDVR